MLVAADRPLGEWLVPAGSRDGDFRAQGVARVPAESSPPTDVALTPFYRTHRRRYSIYFDVVTPPEFDAKVADLAAERERVRRLEAATVGFVRLGDTPTEREFNYQSDPADRPVGRGAGRTSRGGPGWFSLDLPVDAATDTTVVVTYLNEPGLPPATADFQILVDDRSIGRYEPNASAVGFYDAQYAVPAELVRGRTKLTVRFQAGPSGRITPVFGVRTIRGQTGDVEAR
jgi:hypothetical protein